MCSERSRETPSHPSSCKSSQSDGSVLPLWKFCQRCSRRSVLTLPRRHNVSINKWQVQRLLENRFHLEDTVRAGGGTKSPGRSQTTCKNLYGLGSTFCPAQWKQKQSCDMWKQSCDIVLTSCRGKTPNPAVCSCKVGMGIAWYLTIRNTAYDNDDITIQQFWDNPCIARKS